VLDDNRAIALKPRYEIAYMDRGEARVAQGDIAGGLQDYQQAMAIGPALPMIQYRIGAARQAQGDLAGAIAEYDAALKVAFKYPDAYAGRGVAKAARGDLTGALADLRQAQTLAHQRADRTPSLIWLLRVQLNQKAEADQDLTTFLATLPSGWDSKIGEMLIGEIDEDQLLAASAAVQPATARLQQKEAWYYIGMKRLLAGDKPAAASDFQKCVALGDPIEPEDTLARAELVTLGGKPNP
jgi:tetratricopeptide (TPR) repeat protein